MIEKLCKSCFRSFPQYNTAQTICGMCAINRYSKPKKPLKVRGKRAKEYEIWRDEIAIPYLEKTYGHKCVDCGFTGHLDVAHILGRGSNPSLKMDISNVHYKCRDCHNLENGIKW